jgi:sulfur-carrier protein
MLITVKLFAAYQDAVGSPEIVVELPPDSPVELVCNQLVAQYPELEQWRSLTRFGVNLTFVEPETVLCEGDEVVLIPPVSGG